MMQSVFLFAFVQDADYDAYKHTYANITIFVAFVLAIGACAALRLVNPHPPPDRRLPFTHSGCDAERAYCRRQRLI